MAKIKLNFKIAIAIILGIAIIAVSVASLQNDEIDVDLEITETIDDGTISGKHAESICEIMEISCPENPEFEGHLNLDTNYIHYTYITKDQHYLFRISDDKLEYNGKSLIEDEWYSTEGEWIKWPLKENERRKDIYSRTYPVDSDKFGNYEKWCNENNGKFHEGNYGYSNFGCTFSLKSEMMEAREELQDWREKEITGDLAQKLCRAYGKVCLLDTSITMKYDMETGYLYKEKRPDNLPSGIYKIEYRIIEGDVIEYRERGSPDAPWITFED